jgi:hypothetical protein
MDKVQKPSNYENWPYVRISYVEFHQNTLDYQFMVYVKELIYKPV